MTDNNIFLTLFRISCQKLCPYEKLRMSFIFSICVRIVSTPHNWEKTDHATQNFFIHTGCMNMKPAFSSIKKRFLTIAFTKIHANIVCYYIFYNSYIFNAIHIFLMRYINFISQYVNKFYTHLERWNDIKLKQINIFLCINIHLEYHIIEVLRPIHFASPYAYSLNLESLKHIFIVLKIFIVVNQKMN